MNIRMLLTTAFRSLAHHMLRSLLTTIGIIIGVTAIIAVLAIGEGAKYRIRKQIEGLGTNFILVLGGSSKTLARRTGTAHRTLTDADVKAIVAECADIYQISPGVQVPAMSSYEGANWQTMFGGVGYNYPYIREWPLAEGDFFSERDQQVNAKVVVLGSTVRKELFGTRDALGKTIRVLKKPFVVVGVLKARGKRPDGTDEDDLIMAPITTVIRKFGGVRKYAAFVISARSKDAITRTASQIRGILRQQHKLKRADDDDFSLFTQDDIAQASDAASLVLNVLLFVIAVISLIVGGIGIMNIMLVTVTERKKEIGIRLAIGATTNTIQRQFILEAVVICLMGGLCGVALGTGIAYLVGFILGWPIVVSFFSILISLFSSMFIGIFFGYYPARQASLLHPVEALTEQ